MSGPPNILLIMSDEHDPAVTGCYGDPLVRTPHLDRLASEGVRFDGCYCNSPLCVPSRLSLTAGRYVSRFGGWNNASRLPSDDAPSLPRALNAAGYESYLCGKQHYDARHRYGFTDLLPFIHENAGLKHGRASRRAPDDAGVDREAWTGRMREFHAGDHSLVLNNDRLVTQRALEFLRYRRRGQPPFFLFAGYLAPHFPMIVPEPYASRYAGRTPPPIGRPGWEPIEARGVLPNYRHLRLGFGLTEADPADERRGRDLYWSLTEWFDAQVGKLLGGLADSRVGDNTVVVYTSDHGENKGDHGLWWKNCLYEHGARVPLLVRWPARWAGGQARPGACSLVDLVRGLIELGGGEPDPSMDGDSLLPLLDDPAAEWKNTALSEYYGHNITSGMTMWRRGRHKHIYHAATEQTGRGYHELYDLAADPHELNNLADDPGHASVLDALHREMLDELGEHPDDVEARCRRQIAVGYED